MITVAEVMNAPARIIDMDDTLNVVRRVFSDTGYHHLVVVERGCVMGVLSDRDLLRAVSPFVGNAWTEESRDAATLRKRVHQVMTRAPVTIQPHESVGQAARTMLDRRVSCLPVVDGQGRLRGIVTSRDLLRALASMAQEMEVETDPRRGTIRNL